MRITQELLNKFVAETVKTRQRSEPDLHAVYLTGSLLSDAPLLGGTTDIDLILVHKYKIPIDREVKAITQDVCLDILHKHRDDFMQPRLLRQNAWLGYPLTNPNIVLFDTDHWLEFIQASVSAEFHRADNVLKRVMQFYDAAREHWFSLLSRPTKDHLDWLKLFFASLASAANAVTGLIGPPLTTRRFLVDFQNRVETLGVPNILAGFYGLSGFSDSLQDKTLKWYNALDKDYSRILEDSTPPVHLSACRKAYYMNGMKELLESGDSRLALWPIVHVWLDIQLTSESELPQPDDWEDLLESLHLTEASIPDKSEALDAFLDTIEMTLESWSAAYAG